MFLDHRPHYHQRIGERQEQRTKTPYSLHIHLHLITTQLSIATKRHPIDPPVPFNIVIGRLRNTNANKNNVWCFLLRSLVGIFGTNC